MIADVRDLQADTAHLHPFKEMIAGVLKVKPLASKISEQRT
jgi:hypothetical protein